MVSSSSFPQFDTALTEILFLSHPIIVVVVGHTVCGGADACLNAVKKNYPDNQTINTLPVESPLNIWLEPLTKFTRSLPLSVTPPDEALLLVVHENIKKQVETLAQTDTIRDAWARKVEVQIHGWVYDLATGRLKDLHITQGPHSHH